MVEVVNREQQQRPLWAKTSTTRDVCPSALLQDFRRAFQCVLNPQLKTRTFRGQLQPGTGHQNQGLSPENGDVCSPYPARCVMSVNTNFFRTVELINRDLWLYMTNDSSEQCHQSTRFPESHSVSLALNFTRVKYHFIPAWHFRSIKRLVTK